MKGNAGGLARAAALTPERRAEIAATAAAARWTGSGKPGVAVVTVRLTEGQAAAVDRLVESGMLGGTRADVIRYYLVRGLCGDDF